MHMLSLMIAAVSVGLASMPTFAADAFTMETRLFEVTCRDGLHISWKFERGSAMIPAQLAIQQRQGGEIEGLRYTLIRGESPFISR